MALKPLHLAGLAFLAAGILHYTGNPGFTVRAPLPARYDPVRNVGEDFTTAQDIARASGRRILLEIGSEECLWCRRMDAFFTANPALARYRDERFVRLKVAVDHGSMGAALMPMLPPVPGIPHFFVFDTDGRVLWSKDTEELEDLDSYDRRKFRRFLSRASAGAAPEFGGKPSPSPSVELPSVLTPPPLPSPMPDRPEDFAPIVKTREMIAAYERLLGERRFAELDRAFEETAAARRRLFNGSLAFGALLQTAAKALDEDESLAEDWRSAAPESRLARFAAIEHTIAEAWRARGGKSAAETPKESLARFHEGLRGALADLEALRAGGERHPALFRALLTVGKGLEWEPARLREVFNEGRSVNPYDEDLYFLLAAARSPRWGGSFEEMAAIAEEAGQSLEELPPDSGYALVAMRIGEAGIAPVLFERTPIRWERMQQGLAAYAWAFPGDLRTRTAMVFYGCTAQDRATARAWLAGVGAVSLPGVQTENYARCVAWAAAGG